MHDAELRRPPLGLGFDDDREPRAAADVGSGIAAAVAFGPRCAEMIELHGNEHARECQVAVFFARGLGCELR